MINISETQKKIIFIIFFLSFTIGTGYALYYFFFRPAPTATTTPTETPSDTYQGVFGTSGDRVPGDATTGDTGPTSLPIAQDAAALSPSEDTNLLRNSVTQALSVSSNGDTRFYDPLDGKFYTLDADNNPIQLSNRQFSNVDTIEWSNTSDQAILEFPDGSNIFYDFDGERQVTLPSHWEDFEFSPKDNNIVAKSIGLDEDNRYLISATADGNEITALYHLGNNADRVIPSYSPTGQVIGFSKTGDPQPDNGEKILLLGKNHQQYKALSVAGKGFIPSWSPTGKHILYSVHHERDNLKPMLWLSDATPSTIGQNRRKLNINTWADKCTWADDETIYCGVPISLPAGAALDRNLVSSITDDIYKIDIKTGLAKKINLSTNKHSINNIHVNNDGTELIYTDTNSGKLYKYPL
jgi:hypothetical protein